MPGCNRMLGACCTVCLCLKHNPQTRDSNANHTLPASRYGWTDYKKADTYMNSKMMFDSSDTVRKDSLVTQLSICIYLYGIHICTVEIHMQA